MPKKNGKIFCTKNQVINCIACTFNTVYVYQMGGRTNPENKWVERMITNRMSCQELILTSAQTQITKLLELFIFDIME